VADCGWMRTLVLAALSLIAASPTVHGSATALPSAFDGAPAASTSPVQLRYEVVSRRAHDTEAWTQGLVLDEKGRLFESTGLVGRTSLREVEPSSGVVLRSVRPPAAVFGEGLALVHDRLVQLTWRDEVAYIWDVETFELLGSHAYEGEGWGLCFDGQRLVMSDGTSRLTFRDPFTFAPLGSIEVTLEGEPLARLNELECTGGSVWANVWETDTIVRVDPAGGAVTGVLDAAGLVDPHPADSDHRAVLNGIAADESAGTLLLTGKLWPQLVEIRVLPVPDPRASPAPD
jgi:glutamine cyclotransferase